MPARDTVRVSPISKKPMYKVKYVRYGDIPPFTQRVDVPKYRFLEINPGLLRRLLSKVSNPGGRNIFLSIRDGEVHKQL